MIICQQASKQVSKQRLIGLDLFRVASAIIVLAFHSNIHIQCNYGILNDFISMGAIMMTGFFVLSGFSLHHAYQDKELQSIQNIGRFYKKRMTSILPLYYVVGLFYCVFLGKESLLSNIMLAPMELLCLQSCFPDTFDITHNGGTWFISCIVCCYIVFPFINECVKQLGLKMKVCLCLLSVGILLYAPIIVWYLALPTIYYNPLIRILEFFVGILMGSCLDVLQKHSFAKTVLCSKWMLVVECFFLIGGVTILYRLGIGRDNYLLYSWICLPVFLFMIPGLAGASFEKLSTSKLLVYFSKISYALFLAQFPLWTIMRKWFEFTGVENNVFKILSSFICCIGITIVLHERIEKPLQNVLNKVLH